MPRDCSAQALGEVVLPGGRKGRIVPSDDAGQFAVLTATTWVDRLFAAGHLSRDERDAAARLYETFEASGIRQRLVSSCYDGPPVDAGQSPGHLLETMTPAETKAWRRCGKLLNAVPARYRTQVSAVVCWDCQPWDVRALQRGLRVLAVALGLRR
jgi:hypothetical protein